MNWKRFSDELPPENTPVFVAKEYVPGEFTYGTAWWMTLNNNTLVFDDATIGSYNLATIDRTLFYWCEITPPGGVVMTDLEEKMALLLHDIARAYDAKRQLDAGFSGMGGNILGESASRLGGLIRKGDHLAKRVLPPPGGV